MSLAVLADHMASKGRGPDSMLIHMSPREVAGLQSLAMAHGGSLTVNPETGLPEAGFLDKLLPTIIGAGLSFMGVPPNVSAMIVGGIQTVRTGDLGKGISAGLGAYGGANLTSSLTAAGGNALAGEAVGQSLLPAAAEQAALEGISLPADYANLVAKTATPDQLAAAKATLDASPWETLKAGAGEAAKNPMQAVKDYGKYALMAAGPAIAAGASVQGNMPKTTTAPASAAYRPYTYDPYSGTYESLGIYPINPPPQKAAGGGLMGMANGGYNPGQLDFVQRSEPVVRMADGGVPANPAPGSEQYIANIKNWFNSNPNATAADVQGAMQQYGLNQQDVQNAMKQAGLSGAAQFAAFNTDIGSAANTAETYGGLKGLSNNINYWLQNHPGASAQDIRNEMTKWDLSDADFIRATGTDINKYAMGPITDVQNLAEGAGGNTSAVVNENGTITQTAVPTSVTGGQPIDTIQQVKDIYTRGGGSTGYVNKAPIDMPEFNRRFNTLTGGSKQAYEYLMGEKPYSATPYTETGEIMKPYWESVAGMPKNLSARKYIFDPTTRTYKANPDYQPLSYDETTRKKVKGMSLNQVKSGLQALPNPTDDKATYEYMVANKLTPEQVAAALGVDVALIRAKYEAQGGTPSGTTAGLTDKSKIPSDDPGRGNEWSWDDGKKSWVASPIVAMAAGGLSALAGGGMSHLGGYSDGGRLLRGPGDGVSDSIPATIGRGRQPARLADGEFVVPARIVSELGNGSTEAGARKLYAMMDRIQAARRGTVGKGKVAKNSRSEKYLPA
jgi:hypothetical protein